MLVLRFMVQHETYKHKHMIHTGCAILSKIAETRSAALKKSLHSTEHMSEQQQNVKQSAYPVYFEPKHLCL